MRALYSAADVAEVGWLFSLSQASSMQLFVLHLLLYGETIILSSKNAPTARVLGEVVMG